jgi:transglutaminase-like putative cysteine protease
MHLRAPQDRTSRVATFPPASTRRLAAGWVAAVCLVGGHGCDRPIPGAAAGIGHEQNQAVAPTSASSRPTRRFRFHYDLTIRGLPPGTQARVWVPVARTTSDQCVEIEKIDVPAAHRMTVERRFGNRLLFFEAETDEAGRIPVRVDYRVERLELTPESSPPASGPPDLFLDRSGLAPPKGELIQRLLPGGLPGGSNFSRGRVLFDSVDALLAYDKDQPGWGRGDVVWACDARGGNCSDFHSVFIAACQDLDIPARFEVGFPVPAGRSAGEVDGYHCWARFLHDGRWLAVDISEADKHPEQRDEYFGRLPADRVQFTVGRDLILDPPQRGGPINFLIYPHVEIDGTARVEFEKRLRFSSLPESVCADDSAGIGSRRSPRAANPSSSLNKAPVRFNSEPGL